MCLTPYKLRRKHKSVLGSVVREVPCGKCKHCLLRRQRGWTFRLLQEAKISDSCAFLTLTYEDEKLTRSNQGFPTLVKDDYQRFMKRLRKNMPSGLKLKYYSCGEYGTQTNRPHYHSIMYNLPQSYLRNSDRLNSVWQNGHVDIGSGTVASFTYTTKYIMKKSYGHRKIYDEKTGEVFEDDREPEFSLMSKGLGAAFMTPEMIKFLKDNLVNHIKYNGDTYALPRYFKEKIYTESELIQVNKKSMEYRDSFISDHFENDLAKYDEYVGYQIEKQNKYLQEKRLLI